MKRILAALALLIAGCGTEAPRIADDLTHGYSLTVHDEPIASGSEFRATFAADDGENVIVSPYFLLLRAGILRNYLTVNGEIVPPDQQLFLGYGASPGTHNLKLPDVEPATFTLCAGFSVVRDESEEGLVCDGFVVGPTSGP